MKNGRAIVLTRKLHGQTTTTTDDDRHYDYNTPLCRGVKMEQLHVRDNVFSLMLLLTMLA